MPGYSKFSALGRMFRNGGRADAILALLPIAYYNIQSTIQTGGKVSQWNDLSGNGRHAVQSNASLRMTVNSNGTSAYKGYYDVSIPIHTRSFSLHWVVRRTRTEIDASNNEGWLYLFATGSAPSSVGIYSQGNYGILSVDEHTPSNLPMQMFNYDMMPITVTSGAEGLNIYIGGVNVYSSATPNASFTNTLAYIFRSGVSASNAYSGEVSSLAFFDRALTSGEVTALHANTGVSAIGRTPVMCIGDSITLGVLASTYKKTWWYQALDAQGRVGTLFGGSGRKVADTRAGNGLANYQLFDRFVFFQGTNDLAGSRTFAQLRDDTIYVLQSIKTKRPTAKILLVTMLPRGNGTTTPTANFETDRQLFNQWLRDNVGTYADGIVDPGNDANMGHMGQTGATYYVDEVHPNDTGYAVLAGYITAGLAALG